MKRIRSKEEFININTIYTHGGVFHADEVFSTALINIVREYFKLPLIFPERGFNPPMDDDKTLIYDIGGGVYDHHQKDAEYRPNGDKYASFGLLWRDLAPLINLTDEEISYVDNILVKIGVVMTDTPCCKNEQTKNQNEALICTGNDLYLCSILFITK